MHHLNTTYSELSEKARNFHSLILEETEKKARVKELYKGCQTLYSPLIYKPNFLLIGFNPGGGYYTWHNKIVESFTPMTTLEYFLNKHNLGEQTKILFSMAGKEKQLEHSTVKINVHPWATNNIADFQELMKDISKNLSSELFHFSRVWTKNLIRTIEPKTIICEGFKVFDEISVLFPEVENIQKTTYCRSFLTVSGISVIAYKRNQAQILKKDIIKDKLI